MIRHNVHFHIASRVVANTNFKRIIPLAVEKVHQVRSTSKQSLLTFLVT